MNSSEKNPRLTLNQAFHEACGKGNIELVRSLLRNPKVDVNYQNRYGKTGFFSACESQQVKVVALLLQDKRVDVNLSTMDDGNTPFFMSCVQGKNKIVPLLLAHARVNVFPPKSINGMTVFGLTCANKFTNVVSLLLQDHRIDTTTKNKHGHSPLDLAVINGALNVTIVLLEYWVSQNPNLGNLPLQDFINRLQKFVAPITVNNQIDQRKIVLSYFIPESAKTFYLPIDYPRLENWLSHAAAAANNAAQLFALVTFLGDSYLQLSSESPASTKSNFTNPPLLTPAFAESIKASAQKNEEFIIHTDEKRLRMEW